jgi:hypothetical protein
VTVDLYNEGVDIPEVDTLLLLRPTQSPVLFQQQIGRGLRLMPGKESCLVLDFVGQHRAEFRFDRLLSAITGLSRQRLIDAVEHGFTDLAPGCHIHLERQTREQVLRSLRTLTTQRWRDAGRRSADLREIYRESGRSGWTALRRDAGLVSGDGSEEEAKLSSRLGALLHIDDPDYLDALRRVAVNAREGGGGEGIDPRFAQMLTYQLLLSRDAAPPTAIRECFAAYPHCADELLQLADILDARSRLDPRPIPHADDLPLRLHGAYHIREILTAAGFLNAARYVPFQAGVLALHDRRTELLFVTLDKSDGFHDRIAYHDYAISPTRFHWQSQNAAGPDTKAGRRYLESATNGWIFQLFVRANKRQPYRACGPVRIAETEDISGDRPMDIVWTLEVPLPAKLFSEFSVLRG